MIFDKKFKVPDIRDIVAHKIFFGRTHPQFPRNVASLQMTLPNGMKEIPFISKLQELTIKSPDLEDVSSLSHLKKLQLSEASQLTDITPLQNVPHLAFTNCPNIQDFSILNSSKQKRLELNFSVISNLSFFQNIHQLELYECNNVTDISPLYGIYHLTLYSCEGIEDISRLGNHHCLSIVQFTSIKKGFECFLTIPVVEVENLEIPDLSIFRYAKRLKIFIYPSINHQLSELKEISDLSLFSTSFNSSHGIDLFKFKSRRLTFILDIVIINSERIFPSQLRHLELINSVQILKIIDESKTSIFHQLQSLHIKSCWIEHVNGLGEVSTLILENCLELYDIRGLGRNRSVEIINCDKITNVSSLVNVPIVTLKDCHGILNYRCLSSVPIEDS